MVKVNEGVDQVFWSHFFNLAPVIRPVRVHFASRFTLANLLMVGADDNKIYIGVFFFLATSDWIRKKSLNFKSKYNYCGSNKFDLFLDAIIAEFSL